MGHCKKLKFFLHISKIIDLQQCKKYPLEQIDLVFLTPMKVIIYENKSF